MNWDYITGFFDGEGYIAVESRGENRKTSRVAVEIFQAAERGRMLLEQIKSFLESEGIAPQKIRKRLTKHQPMYVLRIYKRSSVLKFIEKIMPISQIKKAEAQGVWDFLQTQAH